MKLKAQFALVLNAFAEARILRGTISAGYNHVMPSQPIAKKVLKRKRKRAAAIPEDLVLSLVMIVSIICPLPRVRLVLAIMYVWWEEKGGGEFGKEDEEGLGGEGGEPWRMTCRPLQTS